MVLVSKFDLTLATRKIQVAATCITQYPIVGAHSTKMSNSTSFYLYYLKIKISNYFSQHFRKEKKKRKQEKNQSKGKTEIGR